MVHVYHAIENYTTNRKAVKPLSCCLSHGITPNFPIVRYAYVTLNVLVVVFSMARYKVQGTENIQVTRGIFNRERCITRQYILFKYGGPWFSFSILCSPEFSSNTFPSGPLPRG